MSKHNISAAVDMLVDGGDLSEAVSVALGRKQAPTKDLRETGGGPSYPHTSTWFVPDENAANQALLLVQNKLGVVGKLAPYSNGAQSGYAITWTGDFGDHDIASIVSSKGGCVPLAGDHTPQDL